MGVILNKFFNTLSNIIKSNITKEICFNLILKPLRAIICVLMQYIAGAIILIGFIALLGCGFWGISTSGIILGIAIYMFLLFRSVNYNAKATWKLFIGFDLNKIITDLLAFGVFGVMCSLGIWKFCESNLPNIILTFTIASGVSLFAGIKNLLQNPFILLGIVLIWLINDVKKAILAAIYNTKTTCKCCCRDKNI